MISMFSISCPPLDGLQVDPITNGNKVKYIYCKPGMHITPYLTFL